MLLAASNDAPFKSVAELLAWPKADPGRTIPYASAGVGSLTHLWGEYRQGEDRLPLEHVGYKGSAEALRDVMAGHVPLFSDVLVPTATPVQRRASCAGSRWRWRSARRCCPTCRRWARRACRHRRHRALRHLDARRHARRAWSAAERGVQRGAGRCRRPQKLQELGFIPVGGTPESYVTSLAKEIEKWRKVIKDSKIPAPA